MIYTTDRDDPDSEGHAELEATDARQGRWGRHMLWVLLASVVLVIIALFGSWAARAPDLEAVDSKSRAVAEEAGVTSDSPLLPAKQGSEGAPASQP